MRVSSNLMQLLLRALLASVIVMIAASGQPGAQPSFSQKLELETWNFQLSQRIRSNPGDFEAYFWRGFFRHYVRKDHDGAISDFTDVIRLKSDHGEAYRNRGHAWHAKKDYDRAIADFSAIIEKKLPPADSDNLGFVHYARADSWLGKNDYDRAIADIDEALRLRPEWPLAYYVRGLAWEGKGDLKRAAADIAQFVKAFPDDSDSKRALARIESLMKSGKR